DDRAQELADAWIRVPQLEDLLDDRAVLGLELARLDGRGRLVRPLVDLDVQPAAGAGLRGAELGTMEADQGDHACATGQATALDDLGDRANRGVHAFVA